MQVLESAATSYARYTLQVEIGSGTGNAWINVKDAPQRMTCLYSAFFELASTSARFEAALKDAGALTVLASLAAQQRKQCGATAAHASRAHAGITTVQIKDDQDCFAVLARTVPPVSSPGMCLWECLSWLRVCAC